MFITVVIPSHNPHRARLARTLAGLRAQSLPSDEWEIILVDNASAPALAGDGLEAGSPGNLSIVVEPCIGLTPARCCGVRAARGEVIVLVDDDNVLDPNYLVNVRSIFQRHRRLGAAGGRSVGEFETPLAGWQREFAPLLAVRDLGEREELSESWRADDPAANGYPHCAPVGAGMALRRAAALQWLDELERNPERLRFDRTGSALTSGGDNDLILTLLERGWLVGYFPQLTLTHLIPSSRLDSSYLARLNRAIHRSWMQVLSLHRVNPWPPIARWTVRLRQAKAWLTFRAWSSPAARIRWQGACGHFEGRVHR